MATETLYIVQAYVAGRGSDLRPEPQVGCRSAEEACRKAERISAARLGVVAYAITADVDLGDYGDAPTILFRSGRLPPPFDEA
ncbi:hypothetical protein GC169_01895 [bacterium]|nr:hypothetical protein [bacterium]